MSTIIQKLDHHDIYDFVNPLKNPKLKEATCGKSVIITGASEGIGKGIAEQFAHAGATTFFLSVRSNTKALQSTADSVRSINPSARVFTQLLDHTSASDVEGLFTTIERELDGNSADVLVNNAGITGHLSNIAHSDIDLWWGSVEILLKGPYMMSRAFIQSTIAAGKKGGVILHTSSIGSYYSVKEFAAYQIGKMGLNRLSEFIRLDHEKDNITSISFHPGGVNTRWWDGVGASNPLSSLKNDLTPDTPALAGGVTVYLTTPDAAYLSGRFVSVNWDLQELETKKEEIIKNALLITTVRGDNVPSSF